MQAKYRRTQVQPASAMHTNSMDLPSQLTSTPANRQRQCDEALPMVGSTPIGERILKFAWCGPRLRPPSRPCRATFGQPSVRIVMRTDVALHTEEVEVENPKNTQMTKSKATSRHPARTAPSTPAQTPPATPVDHAPDMSDRATWQTVYGFRDAVDLVYEKNKPPSKPRLHSTQDTTEAWRDVVFPETAEELLGNSHAVDVLHGIPAGVQTVKTNFIISGGDGTGKRSFLRLLRHAVPQTPELETSCVFHVFDAKKYHDRDLVTKMEETVRKVDGEKTTTFMIVENLEAVPIAVQQHYLLPFVALCNTKKIFAVLILLPDASKLPEQLRQRACLVHMKPLDAMHVRIKLLQICAIQKVGYEREGVEELLKFCKFDLLTSIAKLQDLFVAYDFISLANVRRNFSSASMKRKPSVVPTSNTASCPASVPPYPLSILSMNEPLRRCKLCTLLPPCSHISLKHLHDRVERIRELYPPRDGEPRASLCPSYAKRGICANIQAIGRCRYAHPRGIHAIDTSTLITRCAQHTLPVPCFHCEQINHAKHELRAEELTVEKLLKDMVVSKKLLLDKENERYMFVRDQSKTLKWGAARREYEERLSRLDAALNATRHEVDAQQQELQTRRQHIEKLRDDVVHGRSKGAGKGHGKAVVSGGSEASIRSA